MNHRSVFNMLGRILRLEAFLMLLPMIVALLYDEDSVMAFFAAICVAYAAGLVLKLLSGKKEDHMIFAREGLVTVAAAWVLLSAIGALPFYFSGEIPSYTDAFFETVSGFTTTGASILTDVEAMSHGLLLEKLLVYLLSSCRFP